MNMACLDSRSIMTRMAVKPDEEGSCQDRFFADLIFWGVRGSGHSLAVRPKGYVAELCFLKGRKADRGLRQRVQDYSVSDRRPCTSADKSRAEDRAGIRQGKYLIQYSN